MDNGRPHTAALTQNYLTSRSVKLVKQSPYSPDMNLCDRYLFRHLKKELRPQEFGSTSDVRKAVQRCFRVLSESALQNELENLQDHCRNVILEAWGYVSNV